MQLTSLVCKQTNTRSGKSQCIRWSRIRRCRQPIRQMKFTIFWFFRHNSYLELAPSLFLGRCLCRLAPKFASRKAGRISCKFNIYQVHTKKVYRRLTKYIWALEPLWHDSSTGSSFGSSWSRIKRSKNGSSSRAGRELEPFCYRESEHQFSGSKRLILHKINKLCLLPPPPYPSRAPGKSVRTPWIISCEVRTQLGVDPWRAHLLSLGWSRHSCDERWRFVSGELPRQRK